MRLRPSQKWAGAALLAIGAGVAAFDDPAPPTMRAAQPPGEPPSIRLAERLAVSPRTPLPERALGEPFAARRWRPAEKAAPAPAHVQAAGTFEFRYVGRVQYGNTVTPYLARGNEVFAIKAGDVVDGFTIDAVYDGHIELTSVSQGGKQVMPLTRVAGAVEEAPSTGTSTAGAMMLGPPGVSSRTVSP
jgi:hypothetical protein